MIDQSRQLKISGAEKITDKVIEEKDSKNNNTKDHYCPIKKGNSIFETVEL